MEHKGCTLWFTGLSGSGKSTISHEVEKRLRALGMKVEVLDGDVVRTHLSKGLGFSKEDRDINIRRIGWLCEVLTRNNVVAIAAAISPYRAIREEVRSMVGEGFMEIHVAAPVETADVSTSLAVLLENLRAKDARLVCITRGGRLAGIVDLENISEYLRIQAALEAH